MILYIRHLGRTMQTFTKNRPKGAPPPGALNTRGVGETGLYGRFVANLVNGAITCIGYQSTITNKKHAKRIQLDNFLWPLANRNPDFKIHRIFESYALAFGLLPVVTLRHSVNNRPVKRLPLVASLPPAFYIASHAGWNYGIVTSFL